MRAHALLLVFAAFLAACDEERGEQVFEQESRAKPTPAKPVPLPDEEPPPPEVWPTIPHSRRERWGAESPLLANSPVRGQVVGGRLVVAGGNAIVADGRGGVRAIDVSDPRNPVEMAAYDAAGEVTDVAVEGEHV